MFIHPKQSTVQCNFYQNSRVIFLQNKKPKTFVEPQKIHITKPITSKNKAGEITLSDFKVYIYITIGI